NPATVAMLGLNPADLTAPPAPPAASLAPLAPDVVRTIQTRLRSLGFYGGQIDGIWGPSMQAALERFQQGRGLQATGQLTPATATALGLDPNNLSAPPGPLPAAR
ncbi:MAG: peptidoglycan-binding protein, partial [Acetobacteraceae bacterium]|nr:peptidoglycan-binding protein [Acetobacteraceae bacterium]